MDVAESCIVCKKLTCDCRTKTGRYLQLLGAAADRVISSSKEQSENSRKTDGKGIIDKIILRFSRPISINRIKARATEFGYPFKSTRLNGGYWHLQVGSPGSYFYFDLINYPQELTTKIITNPSNFTSFDNYLKQVTLLIEREVFDARLQRIDFAVDYPVSLNELIHGLDVGFKRTAIEFNSESGKETGIRLGKGSEKIIVYDKGEEQGLDVSRTRIETQLTGAKIKGRTLFHVPHFSIRDDLLSNVVLNEVDFVNPDEFLVPIQRKRKDELATLIKNGGYLRARKFLNKNGNFERDYQPLISSTVWKNQPNDILKRDMKMFMGEILSGPKELILGGKKNE